AATENISAAVMTPCPPRPCIRNSNISDLPCRSVPLREPYSPVMHLPSTPARWTDSLPYTIQQPAWLPLPDWPPLYRSMGHPTQNRSRECAAEKRVAHLFHTPADRRATRRLDSSHGWCSCHLFPR